MTHPHLLLHVGMAGPSRFTFAAFYRKHLAPQRVRLKLGVTRVSWAPYYANARRTVLPLPGGEGRGEGELVALSGSTFERNKASPTFNHTPPHPHGL
jgi:hypothetical protein